MALALLPLAVFPTLFLGLRVFDLFDSRYGDYPLHVLSARLIQAGRSPLWNPYAFAGYPLFADSLTALLYPPSWFFLFLDGPTALNLFVLVEFSIAGVGLFALARWLGLGRLASFLGAVAFMFCGSLTSRIVHLSILSGIALLPLVLLCTEKYLAEGGPLRLTAAAASFALQNLPGHPQIPALTAVTLALLSVVRAIERHRETGSAEWFYRLPARVVAALGIGVMLAGFQLVPWFELAQQSPRASAASFELVFAGSNGLSQWLFFLFPYLHGSLRASYLSDITLDLHAGMRIWENSAYIGLLPLGLAAVGLIARPTGSATEQRPPAQPRYTRLFFGLLLLLALLLASGAHTPFSRLVFATPILGKLRQPARALCLVALSISILAAFGVEHLQARSAVGREPSKKNFWFGIAAAALVLVPLAFVLFARADVGLFGLPGADLPALGLRHPNAYMPLLIGACSAATLAWWGLRPASRLAPWAAAFVILLDLCGYAATYATTADSNAYTREPEVVRYLRTDPTPFRKLSFWFDPRADLQSSQETVPLNWSMVYGIENADGFSSLQPRRHLDFLISPQREDVSYGFLVDPRLFRPESPILNLLNVKYILLPAAIVPPPLPHLRPAFVNESVRVYENLNVLPRAWWAQSVRADRDPRSVLAAVTSDGFDRRREAIVEADSRPELPEAPPEEASIEFRLRNEDRLVLQVSTGAPRFLVLSEMYFDGWLAYVDGVETPIYRTNYLFRGLVVPAGQHAVEFVYRPRSVIQGAELSAGAILLLLLLNGLRRYRQLRSKSLSENESGADSPRISGAGLADGLSAQRNESAASRRRGAQRKRSERHP